VGKLLYKLYILLYGFTLYVRVICIETCGFPITIIDRDRREMMALCNKYVIITIISLYLFPLTRYLFHTKNKFMGLLHIGKFQSLKASL
jgi:hypothetical protein